jgi:transcription antitermination factor NusG
MVKDRLAKIQAQKKTKETRLATSSKEFKKNDLVKITAGMFINQEGRITYLNKRSQKVNIRTESSEVEIVGIPLASCQKVLD